MSDKEENQTNRSRRKFLKQSGTALGGLVVGGAFGGLLATYDTKDQKEQIATETITANPNVALMFFYPDEYQTTVAAAERIFPSDDNGPGAKELHAAIFIDHQLASEWGVNARDYRLGPFYDPEETQGEQIPLLRKDLFRLGLKGLNDYSQKNYKKKFQELDPEQQDEVLSAFEKGKADPISGVSAAAFFKLLRSLTIEGVYADPLYGGNKEMIGWEMKRYPGTRMSFKEQIMDEKFVELEPKSLNSHMGNS